MQIRSQLVFEEKLEEQKEANRESIRKVESSKREIEGKVVAH